MRLRPSGKYVIMYFMELRITATELARSVGDVLGKVRYRRDTFIIERNGEPVARLTPWPADEGTTVAEALRAWVSEEADPAFADDLERVNRADRPPRDPWAS